MKETNVQAEFDFSYEEGYEAGFYGVFNAIDNGIPVIQLPTEGSDAYRRGFINGMQDAIAWHEGYRAAKAGLKSVPYDKEDDADRRYYWFSGYQTAFESGCAQTEGRA